jgi:hypothetical protein
MLTPVVLGVSGVVLLFACLIGCGVVALGGLAAPSATAQQQQQQHHRPTVTTDTTPDTTPPAAPHIPTTLLRLSGGDTSATGTTRSATFSVTGDWQLHYTCRTVTSRVGGALYAVVYAGDGTGAALSGPLGPSSCPQGASSGTVTVHEPSTTGQAHPRYLEIGAASVTWTITVTA